MHEFQCWRFAVTIVSNKGLQMCGICLVVELARAGSVIKGYSLSSCHIERLHCKNFTVCWLNNRGGK